MKTSAETGQIDHDRPMEVRNGAWFGSFGSFGSCLQQPAVAQSIRRGIIFPTETLRLWFSALDRCSDVPWCSPAKSWVQFVLRSLKHGANIDLWVARRRFEDLGYFGCGHFGQGGEELRERHGCAWLRTLSPRLQAKEWYEKENPWESELFMLDLFESIWIYLIHLDTSMRHLDTRMWYIVMYCDIGSDTF